MDLMLVTWAGAVFALIWVAYLIVKTMKASPGNEKTIEISRYVQEGAWAYLKQQYKVVGIFFVALFILLSIISYGFGWLSPFVPYAFITGGFFSGLAGYIGMMVATRANARTAWAAQDSLNKGLRVAFDAGSVMGLVVVGLGLLDLAIWYTLLRYLFLPMGMLKDIHEIPPIMITFGMGASSMALFARVGGGIYTKAADVGADLVGKVEKDIPEDDPRNPATIADNVGDNVGDVAGMGADLYESYVGSIVAAMALGAVAALNPKVAFDPIKAMLAPVLVATIGVVVSIFGTLFVRTKEDATQKNLLSALRTGVYASTGMIAVISMVVIYLVFGSKFMGIGWAMIIGLLVGNIIAYFTEYFTSDTYKPTRDLANSAMTGPGTVIISGLGLGMMSTLVPVLTVAAGTLGAYYAAGGFVTPVLGLYGIGMAAVGMLSTLGITLATDAYGPIADNAGGIAEMAGLDPKVRKRTDALDSLGNTTAATGKGFAIGSAALTALALLAEYSNKLEEAAHQLNLPGLLVKAKGILVFNIMDPIVLAGLFIGAVLPMVFSALTMQAVGRAAGNMVEEVRRQFRENPGIMAGTSKPDYGRCVAISTKGAQREMIVPSLLAIFSPIIVGIVLGPKPVVSMLAGCLASGFTLAVMMANAGGAWDNAKKYIEAGALGGKKSDAHKAAVVGDTVGDPFKDTSGPSINILIKLMCMVSIVFVTTCAALHNQFVIWIMSFIR